MSLAPLIRIGSNVFITQYITGVCRGQTLFRKRPSLTVEYYQENILMSGRAGEINLKLVNKTLVFNDEKHQEYCYQKLKKIAAKNVEEL